MTSVRVAITVSCDASSYSNNPIVYAVTARDSDSRLLDFEIRKLTRLPLQVRARRYVTPSCHPIISTLLLALANHIPYGITMPPPLYPEPQAPHEFVPRKIWKAKLNGQLQPVDKIICADSPPVKEEPQANGDGEQLSAQGYIPHTELYGGLWSNVSSAHSPCHSELTFQRSIKASLVPHETSWPRTGSRPSTTSRPSSMISKFISYPLLASRRS